MLTLLKMRKEDADMKEKSKKFWKSIGNFFVKIGKFIAKVFKVSFNYVKENFWIQPIIIVALIFALVFAFQGIVNNFDKIKGWFTSSEETQNQYTRMSMEELNQKLEAGDDFIFFIGSDTCSACHHYFPVINTYVSTNNVTVYELDISTDENDAYVDYTLKTSDLDEIVEKLSQLTHRDELMNMQYLSTPTTIIVRNGQFVDARIGAIGQEDASDYLDFVEFMNGEQIP